jgi:hypothetical protein
VSVGKDLPEYKQQHPIAGGGGEGWNKSEKRRKPVITDVLFLSACCLP